MNYIETKKNDAAYQFACEEYFLLHNRLDSPIFLLWSTSPTVMLGYYQNAYEELNLPYIEENNIQVVRRNTGGGTIFTDAGGLQFSFIQKGTSDEVDFGTYMAPIIKALQKLGVPAEFNSRNDIEVAGKKISGNAQCTKKGYTLHHGSLLFNSDFSMMKEAILPPKHKIESKGIKSIRSRVGNIVDYLSKTMTLDDFKNYLVKEIVTDSQQQYLLTAEDLAAIDKIYQEKFASWNWTMGKNPQFSMMKSKVFPAGKVTVHFNIQKGMIAEIQYIGDFFTHEDLDQWKDFLCNQPFQEEILLQNLKQKTIPPAIYGIDNQDLIKMLFA